MAVTRGDFLKQLGKSLPGMVLGGGMAAAAQRILGKIAAASSGSIIAPAAGAKPIPAKEVARKMPVADAVPAKAPVMVAASPAAQDAKIEFIRSGPSNGNAVALTFDDGPTPGVTGLILDELQRRDLHATFFMIGERVAAAPDLARRVLAEGHEIGNHTFTHPKLTVLPDHEVEAEIQRTQEIMDELLGHRARWFRPPYGDLRPNQAGIPAAKGLRIALWNVDSKDWSQPGDAEIVRAVLAETKPGALILCHDLHRQTADALGSLLDGLLERKLAFATLSALLK
jgi:peptidoglycan/xylan/chitin deacetylase (PgdA/CDA1 family)